MDLPPPPSYEASTSTSNAQTQNGIPPSSRRSMEDEHRSLPKGWVRQYDAKSEHQFFVDTNQTPPRSIWHHPHDDDEYLNSLTPHERDNLTRLNHSVSLKDIEAEDSGDDETHHPTTAGTKVAGATDPEPHGLHKYARKLKNRVTHSTHEERQAKRQKRAEEEQRAYQLHLAFRDAMNRAVRTGQPQFLAKDRNGRDIFVEPPGGPSAPPGATGYNPYSQGHYADPSARFLRPQNPYSRPYGYGYGGGFGLPMMGGLMGGMLLGGALM